MPSPLSITLDDGDATPSLIKTTEIQIRSEMLKSEILKSEILACLSPTACLHPRPVSARLCLSRHNLQQRGQFILQLWRLTTCLTRCLIKCCNKCWNKCCNTCWNKC